jgi:hypothetical protein
MDRGGDEVFPIGDTFPLKKDERMDEASLNTPYNVNVVVRSYVPRLDQPIIYSTWRNGSFYSASKPVKGPAKLFFKSQTQIISHILEKADIKVACLEDDPTMIIGYVVSTGNHLNYIYIKKDYRNKGIGTLLMPKNIETVSNDLTKTGQALVTKKNLKTKEN